MTISALSNQSTDVSPHEFIERRHMPLDGGSNPGERRQFGSSHLGLSEQGRELAFAIDQYKVQNHRRYLTCDEMLAVLADLGYEKQDIG